MDTKKVNIDKTRTLMVAHRGVSGIERENTAAAFLAAGNRSYFGIETDVHVTSDGKIIVIHDDNTSRVSGVDHDVEKTDFDTLRAVTMADPAGFPRSDLHFPTLEEYIGICKKYGKVAVLELKNRMDKRYIEQICAKIDEMGYLGGTIFISFSLENLVDLRALLPDQAAQYLTDNLNDEVLGALKKYKLGLDIYFKGITSKEDVEKVHAAGAKLNVWTVDEPSDCERLASWGADMITSNICE